MAVKAWTTWILRAVVSLAVVAALLVMVPLPDLWDALRSVSPALWVTTLVLFLAGHAASALKWWLLMTRRDGIPLDLLFRAHFAGLTANLCLPGIAGGDLVRAGLVLRRAQHREDVAVASVADRALDTVSVVALAGVGLVWSADPSLLARRTLLWGTVAIVLGAAAAAGLYLVLRRRTANSLGHRLAVALRELTRRPWLPLGSFAISLAVQTLFVLLNARLGAAAGAEAPLAAWFVAWPLAKLVALLPVSLGGVGLREAALVVFMRPFSVAPAPLVAAGFLWDGVLVAGGLLGGLLTLAYGTGRAVPVRAPDAVGGGADEPRPEPLPRNEPSAV